MKELQYILENRNGFLKFLKSKFPLYHDSNIFFRDLHYGVMEYVEEELKTRLKYLEGEELAFALGRELEKQGVFRKIDDRTWLLNYPEFALPRPAPQKQATQPAAAPSPAQ